MLSGGRHKAERVLKAVEKCLRQLPTRIHKRNPTLHFYHFMGVHARCSRDVDEISAWHLTRGPVDNGMLHIVAPEIAQVV